MAVTLYTYNKLCDPSRLSSEIAASAITIAEDHIETISSPETTNVYMKAALSTEEEAILDRLVEDHVNEPLPENVVTSVEVKRISPAYSFHSLVRDNGSRNMNADGSLLSPVHFYFQPGSGESWEVERLLFGMDDIGLTDFGLFGGISALTNGLLISIRTGGVEHDLGVIKDNVDIAMMFPGMVVGASGVLDAADGIYGSFAFHDHIRLSNSTSDYIRISVRDSLRAVNILRAMVLARKVL